jgi:hypothetical protein
MDSQRLLACPVRLPPCRRSLRLPFRYLCVLPSAHTHPVGLKLLLALGLEVVVRHRHTALAMDVQRRHAVDALITQQVARVLSAAAAAVQVVSQQ